jgi:hypothetical protein
MFRLWILPVLGLIAVLGIACSDEGEDVSGDTATSSASSKTGSPSDTTAPSATNPPEGTLWRWVNVTLIIPDDSDVVVSTDGYFLDDNSPPGLGVRLDRDTSPGDDKASAVIIDAKTGETISSQVLDEDRAAIDLILATLSVGPIDRSTAPWPYNGDAPIENVRERVPFAYVVPAADSGFHVDEGISDGPGGGQFIAINNGISSGGVVLDTGSNELVRHLEHVQSEDMQAVERWMDTVRLCTDEMSC